MNNEEIINDLKKTLEDQCSKAKYDFKDNDKPLKVVYDDIEFGGLRCPNEIELREWFIGILRTEYFKYRYQGFSIDKYSQSFKRSEYYSLKGMIRHGYIEPVMRFLEKRYISNIRKLYDDYSKSKTIAVFKKQIQFAEPIKVCVIDIDTSKKEIIDE